jgi:hypothetical protein
MRVAQRFEISKRHRCDHADERATRCTESNARSA